MEKNEGIYTDTTQFIDMIVEDFDFYRSFISQMKRGDAELSMTRRTLKKQIEEGWVLTIEHALPAISRLTRSPRRFIREEEEILPIELSHNITARSVQHLARHTSFIDRIEDNGDVIPSKILNVYKEETYDTYENKFLNTLIDRLYHFVNKRYDTLAAKKNDEYASTLDMNVKMKVRETDVEMAFSVRTVDPHSGRTDDVGTEDERKSDLWERVKKVRNTVGAFKSSHFAELLGNEFVKPPIMRTNVILKNPDFKECLNLWQFIESYERVGYEIEEMSAAERPSPAMIRELYSMLAFQYVIFRHNTYGDLDEEPSKAKLLTRDFAPRISRELGESDPGTYDLAEPAAEPVTVYEIGLARKRGRLPPDEQKIKRAVEAALSREQRLHAAELREAAKKQKKALK